MYTLPLAAGAAVRTGTALRCSEEDSQRVRQVNIAAKLAATAPSKRATPRMTSHIDPDSKTAVTATLSASCSDQTVFGGQ